ncbi:hypothetical protein LTR15_010680 [Elasticomyces elasticus]|nr:hypothetical protein LTR15_010680 [Elasticomyces elasticus]
MPTLLKLAVETRIQIFTYLLQAPSALRCVTRKKSEKPHPRPFNKQETISLFRRINATALLFVSRQIHHEALGVFYALNTIRIHPTDVCFCPYVDGSWDPSTETHSKTRQHDLLQHVVLDDCSIWTPFHDCGCGHYLGSIVKRVNSVDFPRLKDITINVKGSNSLDELRRQLHKFDPSDGYDEDETEDDDEDDEGEADENGEGASCFLGDIDPPPNVRNKGAWKKYHAYLEAMRAERHEAVRKADMIEVQRDAEAIILERDIQSRPPWMTVSCTGVGRFQVMGEDLRRSITFQYEDIVRLWDYYESLPLDHDDLDEDADPPAELDYLGLPFDLWFTVREFFVDRNEKLNCAMYCEDNAYHKYRVRFGKVYISVDELPGLELSAEVNEYLTRYLVPAVSGQRYFDWSF